MGNAEMVDTMLKDGLWDAFNGYHMGNTAENVAQKFQITRAEQDAFAASSQNKAEAAQKSGRFKDEIVPVTVKTRKGDVVVDTDEFPRHGTTVEALAKLRPAFAKEGGSVTAGNASGINDGAAALVLMSADEAKKRGIKPLAKIVSWATTGVDPAIMGIGPVTASQAALKKAAGPSRISTSSRPTRPSPPRPSPSARSSASIRTSSTSMAAPSRSAIRSAPRARAC